MTISSGLAASIIHAFNEQISLPSIPVRSIGTVSICDPQKWVIAIVGSQEQLLGQLYKYLAQLKKTQDPAKINGTNDISLVSYII